MAMQRSPRKRWDKPAPWEPSSPVPPPRQKRGRAAGNAPSGIGFSSSNVGELHNNNDWRHDRENDTTHVGKRASLGGGMTSAVIHDERFSREMCDAFEHKLRAAVAQHEALRDKAARLEDEAARVERDTAAARAVLDEINGDIRVR